MLIEKMIYSQIVDIRPVDIASRFIDPAYLEKRLDWKTECEFDQIYEVTWSLQNMNPDDYPRK